MTNVKGWPHALDKAIFKHFKANVKTEYNIILLAYTTTPTDDIPLDNDAHTFIRGFMEAVDAMQNGEITYD